MPRNKKVVYGCCSSRLSHDFAFLDHVFLANRGKIKNSHAHILFSQNLKTSSGLGVPVKDSKSKE